MDLRQQGAGSQRLRAPVGSMPKQYHVKQARNSLQNWMTKYHPNADRGTYVAMPTYQ